MRQLRWFLLSVLLFAGSYAAVMRTIDPYGRFRTGLFPQVVFDWRRDKLELFKRFQARVPVEGLILGSSKSMQLEPDVLRQKLGGRFFNFGVDGALAEDDLAIYRWARAQGAHPRWLVIGLDVDTLQSGPMRAPSLEVNEELLAALDGTRHLAPAHAATIALRQYKALFGTEYAGNALHAVQLKLARGRKPTPHGTFEPDGFLHYPVYERQRRDGTFSLEREIKNDIEDLKNQRPLLGLDPERTRYFTQLLDEAARDRTQVIVWLTGEHPRLVQAKKPLGYAEQLEVTRAYLAALPRRYAVTAVDCSDVRTYGGTLTDWYNGGHVDEKNARRILARLVSEGQSRGL